jgi:hypothetical protein
MLTIYVAVLLIAWAIEAKTPKRVNLPGGGGFEGPDVDAHDAVSQGLSELEAKGERDEHTAGLLDAMKSQLADNANQIARLSKENQRLTDENARFRAASADPHEDIRVSRAKRTTVDPDPDG